MVEIPEHLLKRSREARGAAKSSGEDDAAAEEVKAPPEESTKAPKAQAPAKSSGGIPAHLLERSKAARAGKSDGGAAPPAKEPVAAGAGAGKGASSQRPTPAKPSGPARTQRLLAVVKSGSIQTTKRDPVDKVNTWPHLLSREFVALLLVSAFLIGFSILVNAPLQEAANPNETPNPSKAPWYFLGLQELLTQFDPMVAGVMLPGIGVAGLMAAPYIDRNRATKPSERKFATSLFTMFMIYWAVLTLTGIFFRGPGQNFVWPWSDGIFFDF